jgi:hypothetical protein
MSFTSSSFICTAAAGMKAANTQHHAKGVCIKEAIPLLAASSWMTLSLQKLA